MRSVRAKIPCVFMLGGEAFVVGAVVGFASSSTFRLAFWPEQLTREAAIHALIYIL